MKDPLTISLVAQRIFNHELLLALIESGALTQLQAGSVAGKTAIMMREMLEKSDGEAFAAKIADGYEQIAAAILGLPKINPQ